MGALAAFPVLIITLMLQLAIISRLPLLHGTADLMLLVLVAWALQERVRTAWFGRCLAGYWSRWFLACHSTCRFLAI